MTKFAALAALALCVNTLTAGTFKLDGENTKVEWTGSKPEGKHTGGFKELSGTASVEGDAPKVEVEIDCASLYSDDPKLTAHLKAPDFFSVKEHPKAKFVSTKVEKGANGYTVTGNLTLCGKTKEVTFPAEVKTGDGFSMTSKFTINRTDFGMTYGKGKIADDVEVRISVDAKK
jgi:polyisoprenoid-binding protein YceI